MHKPVSTINGHKYVNLSVKWATCNIGAYNPSDYDKHFAWSETTAKYEYTENNSVTWFKSINDIFGNPRYYVAHANWGGTWRLPTASELYELMNRCVFTWTTEDKYKWYRVMGPNGNSIFLLASGWRRGFTLFVGCFYWSSTPYELVPNYAYDLDLGNRYYRYYGYSVRPVSK